MAAGDPSFTVGIGEEYLLVDRRTRDIATEPPAAMIFPDPQPGAPETAAFADRGRTRVCHTIAQARDELA